MRLQFLGRSHCLGMLDTSHRMVGLALTKPSSTNLQVIAAELPSGALRSLTFGFAMAIGFVAAWLTVFTTPYFLQVTELNWGAKVCSSPSRRSHRSRNQTDRHNTHRWPGSGDQATSSHSSGLRCTFPTRLAALSRVSVLPSSPLQRVLTLLPRRARRVVCQPCTCPEVQELCYHRRAQRPQGAVRGLREGGGESEGAGVRARRRRKGQRTEIHQYHMYNQSLFCWVFQLSWRVVPLRLRSSSTSRYSSASIAD